jgi:hypothetical protein
MEVFDFDQLEILMAGCLLVFSIKLIIISFCVVCDSHERTHNAVDIDFLLKLASMVKCKLNSRKHCERGTVSVDSWLDYALSTQRFIQQDLPWDKVNVIGTHNSYNSRADNYGLRDTELQSLIRYAGFASGNVNIAQQEFSMTDTLNFGVRSIQLDPQWCFGQLRLSHAGQYFPRRVATHSR